MAMLNNQMVQYITLNMRISYYINPSMYTTEYNIYIYNNVFTLIIDMYMGSYPAIILHLCIRLDIRMLYQIDHMMFKCDSYIIFTVIICNVGNYL